MRIRLLNRTAAPLACALVLAVSVGSVARAASSFGALCRKAMSSYYGALLASAHGDADATLRHLVLLQARWDEATRAAVADRPLWLGDRADGATTAMAVAAALRAARERLPGDVAGAHAALERVRAILHQARDRRHALTFDDAVTEYHEAMERLTAAAGASNEIALNADDFPTIGRRIATADAAWHRLREAESPVARAQEWTDVATRTSSDLTAAREAAGRQDGPALQRAAESLKKHYYELLTVLSRT